MQKQSKTKQIVKSSPRSESQQLKVAGIITVTVVALYIVSLFVPLVSPFTRYPLYMVKCGGQPIAASNFASGNTYTVPGDENYDVGVFTNHYFCNESEAHEAGFRKR